MAKITLPRPPGRGGPSEILDYLRDLHSDLEGVLLALNNENQTRGEIYRVKAMAKADLPKNTLTKTGDTAFVTDETGGAVLAFYDGTDWRRVTDRTVVS